jgi:hypothetical protein
MPTPVMRYGPYNLGNRASRGYLSFVLSAANDDDQGSSRFLLSRAGGPR